MTSLPSIEHASLTDVVDCQWTILSIHCPSIPQDDHILIFHFICLYRAPYSNNHCVCRGVSGRRGST